MTEPEPKPCTCVPGVTPWPDFGHSAFCPRAKDLQKRAIYTDQKRLMMRRIVEIWDVHCPALRFGQFIANAHASAIRNNFTKADLFDIEDQVLLEICQRFVKES